MQNTHWTPEEDDYLLTWASKKPTHEIATDLDRTIDSIRNRAKLHHIPLGVQWKQDELAFLEEAGRSTHSRDIASSLDRSITAVRRKRRLLGLTPDASIFNRHLCIDDAAFDAWSEEAAYWMGFIAADGSLRRRETKKINGIALQLAEKDADHLRRLQTFLQSEHPVSVKNGKVIFVFSSASLFQKLLENGITPNKTTTLQFPSHIPARFQHHFVRGYFDGDGSVGKGADRCPFFSLLGTEAFL